MTDISLTQIVDGVRQWAKAWDSPFHRNDFAVKMALAPNGDVYTTGSSGNGHYADMLLLKWSSSGASLPRGTPCRAPVTPPAGPD